MRTKNLPSNNVCEQSVDFCLFCDQQFKYFSTSGLFCCRVRLFAAHLPQLLSKITFQGFNVNGNCVRKLILSLNRKLKTSGIRNHNLITDLGVVSSPLSLSKSDQ